MEGIEERHGRWSHDRDSPRWKVLREADGAGADDGSSTLDSDLCECRWAQSINRGHRTCCLPILLRAEQVRTARCCVLWSGLRCGCHIAELCFPIVVGCAD
nr:MAG: hypothetical protein DIU60_02025 [Actinomycetota bacterium]